MADRCEHCSVRMDGLETHADDCPTKGPELREEIEALTSSLDAAIQERDRWEDAYRLLSTQGVYEGNSTYHWWAKAHAYSGIVFQVCEAFRKLGYKGEFDDLPTLASRLTAFAEQLSSGERNG